MGSVRGEGEKLVRTRSVRATGDGNECGHGGQRAGGMSFGGASSSGVER